MNHYSKYIFTVVGLFILFAASGGAFAKPFGNPEDIAFGKKLWTALEKNHLAGVNSFRTSRPYKTDPPHGNIVETMDGKIKVGKRRAVVIVKKNFGIRGTDNKTTVEQVANSPAKKYMTSITVMFRREKGYDPENKNWFWAKYSPDGKLMKNPKGMALAGRVAKGSDKACIACHAAAPGDDYVYTHDKYAK